jgi:hypothetical protein
MSALQFETTAETGPDGVTIAIVGSRTFPYDSFPQRALSMIDDAITDSGWTITEIVSGGADGADAAGAAWADGVDVPCQVFDPEWEPNGEYDPTAGFKRNAEIVRTADCILAIWNGRSKGTKDTIGKARSVLGDGAIQLVPIGNAEPTVDDVSPVPIDTHD